MVDIITFRFFLPFLMFFLFMIPTVWSYTDSYDVVNQAAREAARKASIDNNASDVEQAALQVIQGDGKPIAYGGVTLFDPQSSVDINWYDGDECTVTVHYKHYLLFPGLTTLIGGEPLGPTIDMQQSSSFERTW